MRCYYYYTHRVHKVVGPDGLLKKDDFIRILQSSNFFMKTFDKNQDGIVTEVELNPKLWSSTGYGLSLIII